MGNQEQSHFSKYQMDEMDLILVFRRAIYFLSVNEALQLLCLNSFFLKNLPNQEFYYYVSKSISSWIANLNENDPDLITHFAKFLECQPFNSFKDVYNCIKNAQNMIKNPCGELKFAYWNRIDGGDCWTVEDWPAYRHKKTVFVSSRGWSEIIQAINIPESSQRRFLIVGAHVSRRSESEALTKLRIAIYDEDNEIKDVYRLNEVNIPESSPDIYLLKCKFEIQPYCKKVQITYSGKDIDLGNGSYGARFIYCYARIFNSPNGY